MEGGWRARRKRETISVLSKRTKARVSAQPNNFGFGFGPDKDSFASSGVLPWRRALLRVANVCVRVCVCVCVCKEPSMWTAKTPSGVWSGPGIGHA